MTFWSYKLSGTGNTFHVIACSPSQWEEIRQKDPEWITQTTRRMCEKSPADGVVFFTQHEKKNFLEWIFRNCDGSHATLCGNAARCVAFLSPGTKLRLKTEAGDVFLSKNKNLYSAQLPKPELVPITAEKEIQSILSDYKNELGDLSLGLFCRVGIPHYVLHVDNLNETYVKKKNTLLKMAQRLRSSSAFGPEGTNVTFVENSEGIVFTVTFERGVESFTAACGTGVVAAAFAHLRKKDSSKAVTSGQQKMRAPGGDLLVSFEAELPTLTGEVDQLDKLQFSL